MSLRDVAEKLGISTGYLSDCEHDRRNPNNKLNEFWKARRL